MVVTNLLLQFVDQTKQKKILEIGAHEDSETIALAKHFQKVCSYYEFLKIPERSEKNIELRKMPYLEVLSKLPAFDVILIENEFHHFPDIWQMWTYDKLLTSQDLFLVEWDFTGNTDQYYLCFQNCRPLCQITREVLDKFISKKIVRIEHQAKGKYEEEIKSRTDMINYHKFLVPDHWRFGEADFLRKIENQSYPLTLWEGFNFYHIKKL